MARIAVLAPPTKDGVHNLARPDHLQGLKAFDFFVGGLHPVSLRRLVVIQHHGIDGGLDELGTRQLQPPHKQLIENATKASAGHPRKGFEKSFHRMRRRQLGRGRLERGRIPRIGLQVIKVSQVPTGPVEQETKELLEEGPKGEAFAAFTEMAKGFLQERRKLDFCEVAHKEG